MKLQSIQTNNINQTYAKKPEFKGAVDALVTFWDVIGKGGMAASFILQDVCGSVVPRTWVELNRGKEETGKLNYAAAAETAIRECTTSPTLFLAPALTMGLITAAVGKANNLPLSQINDFTAIMQDTVKEIGEEKVKADPKAFKKAFYDKVIDSICEGTFNGSISREQLSGQVENLNDIVEKAVSSDGKVDKKTLKEAFKKLDSSFALAKQHSSADYSTAFSNAILRKGGSEDRVSTLFKNAENYYADFSKKLAKSDVTAGQMLDSFKNSRLTSRFATGLIATVATMGAMFMLPKLYQLSDSNPVSGDVKATKDNPQENAENKQGKVSFKGGMPNALSDGGSFLSKFGKFFDPKGHAISPGALTLVLSTCVVIPRLLNARDNTERREVFTRDVPTVATVLFAKKGISGLIAKGAEKKSGAIITNGPTDYNSLSAFAKFKKLFQPNGGVTVFGSEDFMQKYTNIKDQETFGKMLEYVKKSGGDIKKLLSIDENAKTPSMFDFAKDVLGNDFKKMSDVDILDALKSKENAEKVESFVKNTLDKPESNPIIQSCRRTSGIIQTVSFLIAVGILGIALPNLNVLLSKRAKAKEAAKNEPQATQKPEVNQAPKAQDTSNAQAVKAEVNNSAENAAQNQSVANVSDLIEARQSEAEREAFKQFAEV
ncbi:hypothetical protein IKA15_00990 [bacterium]|nr:hypothetical protein [bacterium]